MATTTARSKDNNKTPSVRQTVPETSSSSKAEPIKRNANRINKSDECYESVLFIWFDPEDQPNMSLIGPLRAINDNVQVFTNLSLCLDRIRSSKEKIFFITSMNTNELTASIHNIPSVEAIFILDSNTDGIRGDFPKLFGIFTQQGELLRVVKEASDTFEQIQFEDFEFEQEKVFLWLQLWKEDLISRKVASSRQEFIETVRHHYRDNTRIMELTEELEKSYRPGESIHWCIRSPFPSRFLLHALRSHSKTQLKICRFLFSDASRFLHQQPKHKSSEQVYRGMKLSNELLNQFEAHIDQLVCTSSFFLCTKSRTNALASASLPTYRSDLLPVFFKIDCDTSSLHTEILGKDSLSTIVFDPSMAFRIVYVNRGQMSIIKMKTAGEGGRKIALDYIGKHKDETIQSILDELLRPPKPPTPPPPPPSPPKSKTPTPPSPPSPPKPKTPPPSPPKSIPEPVQIHVPMETILTVEEEKAQSCVDRGDVDLALIAYQRIKPTTPRILNIIGQLCANRKGDYNYALKCHEQALKMQQESGEDISETLAYLGSVHENRGDFYLALDYYKQSLELSQSNPKSNPTATIICLLGLAAARLARGEFAQAITDAERALNLQENLKSPNETDIASTLALLGNIYHESGKIHRALDLCTRALNIFERNLPSDSPILAELLCSFGTIQSKCEFYSEAEQSLERSVEIYTNILPQGHQDRLLAENELKRIRSLRKNSSV